LDAKKRAHAFGVKKYSIPMKILLTIFTYILFISEAMSQDYVVFSKEEMNSSDWDYNPKGPYWTPSDNEVEGALSMLPSYISNLFEGRESGILKNYDEYNFQISGLYSKDDKVIYIYALCDETSEWRQGYFLAADGGSCYWKAYYNIRLHKIISVEINGEA
jgi:hypothetical protein